MKKGGKKTIYYRKKYFYHLFQDKNAMGTIKYDAIKMGLERGDSEDLKYHRMVIMALSGIVAFMISIQGFLPNFYEKFSEKSDELEIKKRENIENTDTRRS